MAYTFLSLWIIPFGLVLVIRVLPAQLRGLRTAGDRHEKTYWVLNVLGYLLVAYGALTTGLVMVDCFCGSPWQLCARWPSISRLWGLRGDQTIMILLDLLTALAAGLILVCAARYFGYVDESGVWRRPDWLAGGQMPEDAVFGESPTPDSKRKSQ